MKKLKKPKTDIKKIKKEIRDRVGDINSLDNKFLKQKGLKLSVRRTKALELRKEGKSYQQIGMALEISASQAFKDVGKLLRKEIEQSCKSKLDQVIQLDIERLDLLFEKAWGEVKKGNLSGIDRALKIMERRAKYLGLDAPAKSVIGEDPEKPFGGDQEKLKSILATMIKNKKQSKAPKTNE